MAKRATAKKRRRIAPARVRYEDIAAEFHQEAVSPGRVLIHSGYDLDHLRRFFRRRAVTAIDAASIREYTLWRQDQTAPIQTINGELDTLVRVLQFAAKKGKVRQVPKVELLMEPLPVWFGAPNPLSRRVDPVEFYFSRKQPGDWPLVTPPPAKERGKLTDAVWAKHVLGHALETDKNGKLLRGASWRRRRIEIEQGIKVDTSTVTRRLQKVFRRNIPAV